MPDVSGHPNNYQGYGYDHDVGSFEQMYRCYPSSLIDKSHVESGDKIIMPQSALDRLGLKRPRTLDKIDTTQRSRKHHHLNHKLDCSPSQCFG